MLPAWRMPIESMLTWFVSMMFGNTEHAPLEIGVKFVSIKLFVSMLMCDSRVTMRLLFSIKSQSICSVSYTDALIITLDEGVRRNHSCLINSLGVIVYILHPLDARTTSFHFKFRLSHIRFIRSLHKCVARNKKEWAFFIYSRDWKFCHSVYLV